MAELLRRRFFKIEGILGLWSGKAFLCEEKMEELFDLGEFKKIEVAVHDRNHKDRVCIESFTDPPIEFVDDIFLVDGKETNVDHNAGRVLRRLFKKHGLKKLYAEVWILK